MDENSDIMVTWLEETDELLLSIMCPDTLDIIEQYALDCETAYTLYSFLQEKFRKIIKVSADSDDIK